VVGIAIVELGKPMQGLCTGVAQSISPATTTKLRHGEWVMSVRPPAVAGSFYPSSRDELVQLVQALLANARPATPRHPKALIVPHAGYVYSGPIAASAFALLVPHAAQIQRVVLIGPTHRVLLRGVAAPGSSHLRTPVGDVEVDQAALDLVPELEPNVAAHAREHSLEVMLPFLQAIVPHAKLVPLVAGDASHEHVGELLERLWGGPETVIVISSDLSHYLPYAQGRALDQKTATRIVELDTTLSGDDACGAVGINGLLWVARRKQLGLELLDLRSSGDTARPMARGDAHAEVVGYGAFACYQPA
jgi:MEMO1 family protein